LAISAVNKEFGEGSLMRTTDAKRMNVSVISAVSLSFDLALGVGGLPRGTICEIVGPECSGKTTLCLNVIAEAQHQGVNAVSVDLEHIFDPKYTRILGVDLDNVMASQPESGEEALNRAEMLIRSGTVDVIVIDSVAAIIPKAEMDGQIGNATIGLQTRMTSQVIRRLTFAVSKTQYICIFTNQTREQIDVMFGSPETTPGGVSARLRTMREIFKESHAGQGYKKESRRAITKCEFDIMHDEASREWVHSSISV
jgi:recombination protein RecA